MRVCIKTTAALAASTFFNFGCAATGQHANLTDTAPGTGQTALAEAAQPMKSRPLPCYEPEKKRWGVNHGAYYVMHKGRMVRLHECL